MRFAALIAILLLIPNEVDAIETAVTYEQDVRPLFARHCFRCHGSEVQKAELNLESLATTRRGGESGEVLVPGEPEESLLLQLVAAGEMPPEEDKHLTESEIQVLTRWIKNGRQLLEASAGEVSFHDVVPLLYRRCVMCHGPEYQLGDFDARSKESLLRGGASGPALIPGDPEKSLMVRRVVDRSCPPKADLGEAGIEPMSGDELETVSRWVAAGAQVASATSDAVSDDNLVSDDDRRFWSYRPPVRPPLPAVQHAELVRNPIDAFLLRKLEANQLTYSSEVDRATLIRRVTFALTGLPPAPDEVAAFVRDTRPAAYERLIDRLLASSHYGEKWGRFWLDLAGYADSEGKRNADMLRPFAYRYRDYVIQAFNADKPYDAFLVEQLAGDELVDYANPAAINSETIEKLVATGFLRMAPDGTSADPVNRISDRVEVIADEIDVLSRGVMGMTMQCARCHSHKYDPIPQSDYYRLVAIFRGAYDEYDWLTPQPFTNQWKLAKRRHLEVVLPATAAEIAAQNAPLQAQIDALKKEQETEKDQKVVKSLATKVSKLETQLRPTPLIRALWDRGRPSPTYVYRRGVDSSPGRLVEPGVPAVLTDGTTPFQITDPGHSSPKTGRRLSFARWLTRRDHPLTSRVLANRIWQQHFGTGIVESIDDFGRLGTPPSHPDLLDWLAVEFVESGWSLKHLHRLIMTSTAYRQTSRVPHDELAHDPANRLLSRMPMRRLSAEELRDSLLTVADRLSHTPFGEPDPVEVRGDGLVTSKPQGEAWRRSVYVRHRRKEMPTILETFDLPQMNPNCTRRMDSTVVSQPLHLLNNQMIYDLSRAFAERVMRETADLERRIDLAFRLALGRTPEMSEQQIAEQAVEELTKTWEGQGRDDAEQAAFADYCHVLLNSAAFLYLD